MSSSNIIFGSLISLIGIYAIIFNKYPGKKSLMKMQRENLIQLMNES